jgi:ABC-type antimicrobial peptide transport system permease subunit
MGSILSDLRFGLRLLAKTPAFTVVAILSLALGIGANTTVFSLMDAVMLRSLPVQNPEQIVEVATVVNGGDPRIEPALTVYDARTLQEHVGTALYVERMQSITLGLLGLLALVLTAIGIYGVVAYPVAQRTRELGIRMALGAQRIDVLKLILFKGLTLVAAGSAIGLLACYWLSSFVSSQLYGVAPYDPITLLSVAAILALVALLASYIPARRATRVNPLVALRYE